MARQENASIPCHIQVSLRGRSKRLATGSIQKGFQEKVAMGALTGTHEGGQKSTGAQGPAGVQAVRRMGAEEVGTAQQIAMEPGLYCPHARDGCGLVHRTAPRQGRP